MIVKSSSIAFGKESSFDILRSGEKVGHVVLFFSKKGLFREQNQIQKKTKKNINSFSLPYLSQVNGLKFLMEAASQRRRKKRKKRIKKRIPQMFLLGWWRGRRKKWWGIVWNWRKCS